MSNSPGQLSWLPRFGSNGERILHLRLRPHDHWQPYTSSPLAVPDYPVPNGTKGWATFQKLFDAGWELVGSNGQIVRKGDKE